jgi:hypothetical protein
MPWPDRGFGVPGVNAERLNRGLRWFPPFRIRENKVRPGSVPTAVAQQVIAHLLTRKFSATVPK